MNTTRHISPGIVTKRYTPSLGYCASLTGVTEFPGKGMRISQNFQKFRVRVRVSYKTSRSSGYGVRGVQSSQKFRAGAKHVVPVPRVLLPRAYRTSRSSGYRYECRTEHPEAPGTGINALPNLQKFLYGSNTQGKHLGYGLYVSYITQPCNIALLQLRTLYF